MKPTLAERMSQKVLLLDGAMGTLFQQMELDDSYFEPEGSGTTDSQIKRVSDILNLTAPDRVQQVHRRYLEAGADLIETNTFNAQRISLSCTGWVKKISALNFQAARLARELADEFTERNPEKPRYVLGAIGPTPCICVEKAEENHPITVTEMQNAYLEQMSPLLEGGVDALLIETIYSLENARAAISAALKAMKDVGRDLPLMLSFTAPRSINVCSFAKQVELFLHSLPVAPILSVGLNCSYGAVQMRPFVKELSKCLPYYIGAYPCAGLPDAQGNYEQTPEQFAQLLQDYVKEGWVNFIGGCCGTTDAHISCLSRLIEGTLPHQPVRT